MAAGQRVRVEALVVRLDPTRAQRDELMRWAGARRVAFNWALDMIRVNQAIWAAQRALEIPARERVRPFSFFDLDGLWRNVYRADVAPWHGEVAAVVFTFAIRDAVEAHKRFLSGTARFPHYRSRRKNRPVATVRAARLEARAVVLPRIGSVKICSADPAQARLRRLIRRGRARLLNVTVSRHADGRWYASLAVERQIIHQAGDAVRMLGPIVGADVGVKSLVVAATSDAKLFDEAHGVKHLRQAQRRLRHAQRAVSRKDRAAAGPGATRITASTSAQRAKAVARLARAHAQVSRRRADGTNVLSKKLATSAGVIVVEDLAVRSMMASGGSHKRGLNRAIADAGFGEIRRQLVYKTVRHGSVLVARGRPVVLIFEALRPVRVGESQAYPRRAPLCLRQPRLRPPGRPGPQRSHQPRHLGRGCRSGTRARGHLPCAHPGRCTGPAGAENDQARIQSQAEVVCPWRG